jgi:drug/metabolite transporter (DMT)-like permease
MKSIHAELMLLLMTVVWGATFLFTKIGLEFSSPYVYLLLRFIVAISLVVLIFGKHLRNINVKIAKQGIFLGLLFGLGFTLQTTGLELTEIQKSAFITGLTVALTPFAFRLISKRKISHYAKIGVIIATFGLYIFTDPSLENFNKGDFLTLLSTFCWAFFISYLDKFTKGEEGFSDMISLVFMQMIGAVIIIIIAYFVFEFPELKFEMNSDLLLSVLFNGIIASFVLMIVHTKYQRYTTAVKAALIFSMEPIFASIFAMIFIQEFLNSDEYLGAVIMLFGVLFSELGPVLFKKTVIIN